ncbi:MAG: ATP-binding protein [Myxococcales bacterium]|nr:ATP-binding protein [Myxococcales bacterium]
MQGNLAEATFIGTPVTDIYFAWKQRSAQEEEILALDRDDPLLDHGGVHPFAATIPNFNLGPLEGRLVPGPGYSRIGIKPVRMSVRKAPAELSISWDAKSREARVRSEQISKTGQLHLALHHLVLEEDEAPETRSLPKPVPVSVGLWSDAAPDVIIDLGMSKTVVLAADSGPFLWASDESAPRVFPSADNTAGPHGPPETPETPETRETPESPPTPEAPAARHHVLVTRAPDEAPPAPQAPEPVDRAEVASRGSPPAGGHAQTHGRGAATPPPQVAAKPEPPAVHVEPEAFGTALLALVQPLVKEGLVDTVADLTMLLLALSTRPFVLLAGPPGSGKSSLARLAAQILGLFEGTTYHEITVQPHWKSQRHVEAEVRASWTRTSDGHRRLYLFDEINLASPESYLMPFLRLLDKQPHGRAAMLACGTLNIDDSSRPPSPTIIDRAFFIEIDAPKGLEAMPNPAEVVAGARLDGLPAPAPLARRSLSPRVGAVVEVLQQTVEKERLRQDLLPSRRDLIDLAHLTATYESCALNPSLLSLDDLEDHLVAGRLLTKIAGAAEQVEPLVRALEQVLSTHPRLRRCQRRLAVARAQLRLGFVSPWQ